MIQFKSTTTPKSEQLLAHTLGYPKSWHVVRKCPHPILQKPNTFQDIIYTGNPQVADMYFNHTAAMEAAMRWKGEEGDDENVLVVGGEDGNNLDNDVTVSSRPSTAFDNDGGHMLPMEGDLVHYWEEGDEVEVYYDSDQKWHHATIVEVIEYRDDERYTVKYTADEATQTNVCHEKLRVINKSSKKRKKSDQSKNPSTPVSSSTESSTTKRARTSMNSASAAASAAAAASPIMESPIVKSTFTPNYVADTKELELGAKMGLPEGWAVNIRPNSRYTFHSPEGERFSSKKAVYTRLGLPLPKHGYNPLNDDDEGHDGGDDSTIKKPKKRGRKPKKRNIPVVATKNENDEHNDDEVKDPTIIEDGDPPWRTKDHKFLGKRIKYTFPDGITGKGTVSGWISETDVDKDGNPGFVSDKTNEAACLFHVTMDADCAVASQDFEDFEVEEILVDDNEED